MSDSSSKERAGSSSLGDAGAAIKRESRQVADEARAAGRKMACDQRDALAGYVSALADAANRGADDLDSKGYGRSASTVARTADEVEGFARRLQEREPGELWEDVEDFAREHPALVFGAGFALAFGVTRFLRSSVDSAPSIGSQGAEEESEVAATSVRSGASQAASGSGD